MLSWYPPRPRQTKRSGYLHWPHSIAPPPLWSLASRTARAEACTAQKQMQLFLQRNASIVCEQGRNELGKDPVRHDRSGPTARARGSHAARKKAFPGLVPARGGHRNASQAGSVRSPARTHGPTVMPMTVSAKMTLPASPAPALVWGQGPPCPAGSAPVLDIRALAGTSRQQFRHSNTEQTCRQRRQLSETPVSLRPPTWGPGQRRGAPAALWPRRTGMTRPSVRKYGQLVPGSHLYGKYVFSTKLTKTQFLYFVFSGQEWGGEPRW